MNRQHNSVMKGLLVYYHLSQYQRQCRANHWIIMKGELGKDLEGSDQVLF